MKSSLVRDPFDVHPPVQRHGRRCGPRIAGCFLSYGHDITPALLIVQPPPLLSAPAPILNNTPPPQLPTTTTTNRVVGVFTF